MHTTNNHLTDYDSIITTINCYIEGCKAGKSELMRPGFHQDAIFVAYAGGNLLFGSPQILYDWVDANGSAADIKPNFASIEILETIAVVRLEVYGWSGKLAGSGVHMSDLFTLIKIEEGWKISQKMAHWHVQ